MNDFQMQENDAKQLKKYIDDIQKEWPKATIEPYLIYCFGNQGFKVYPLNMTRNNNNIIETSLKHLLV